MEYIVGYIVCRSKRSNLCHERVQGLHFSQLGPPPLGPRHFPFVGGYFYVLLETVPLAYPEPPRKRWSALALRNVNSTRRWNWLPAAVRFFGGGGALTLHAASRAPSGVCLVVPLGARPFHQFSLAAPASESPIESDS